MSFRCLTGDGCAPATASATIRFTLGHDTTGDDVDSAVEAQAHLVEKMEVLE